MSLGVRYLFEIYGMHLQHDANGDFFVCPEQILPHMKSDCECMSTESRSGETAPGSLQVQSSFLSMLVSLYHSQVLRLV